MLAHLGQDGANVQMNVSWVQHLQAIIYALVRIVQIVILDLKSLLQIRKGRSQLLCSSENASKIIVGHCSVFIALLGQSLGFSQELKGNIKVF